MTIEPGLRPMAGFRAFKVWLALRDAEDGVRSDNRRCSANTAASPLAALLAIAVHTTAHLAVTGLIAWVVYRKFGLAVLSNASFNLHLVWALALIVTSLVTLVI